MFRPLLSPSSGDKKTRMVNTSCEATCNIGRESLGSIVVDTVSLNTKTTYGSVTVQTISTHRSHTQAHNFNNVATHNIYNNTTQAFSPYVTGSFTWSVNQSRFLVS
jgi:dihydroorotate dehydrogenase